MSEALERNVTATWGDAGREWLAALPRTLAALAADWELAVGAPFELSYHYVVAVTCADGSPGVLKLGVPSRRSLATEVPALTAWAGRGAARVLRVDPDRGALLLERVVPGWRARELVPHRDAEATSAAVAVMRRLHAAPADAVALPDLVGEAGAFDAYLSRLGTAGPLPADLVATAAGLIRELSASAPDRAVLHGDLHHDNILRGEREPWLAIDPHGVVGDPGYDLGALLYNPDPDNRDEALTRLVPARVEQLAAELAMPLDRVVAWGFVKAMLSDVWTADDWTPGASWSPASRALDVARLLAPRLS
jgi:streptomycin 6-kinase